MTITPDGLQGYVFGGRDDGSYIINVDRVNNTVITTIFVDEFTGTTNEVITSDGAYLFALRPCIDILQAEKATNTIIN